MVMLFCFAILKVVPVMQHFSQCIALQTIKTKMQRKLSQGNYFFWGGGAGVWPLSLEREVFDYSMIKGECNCNLLCAISCGFRTFSKIAFIYSVHFIITHSFHELVKQNAINNYFRQKVQWLISCILWG